MSLRVEDDRVIVATSPVPEEPVARLRKTLFWVGLVLAGWWALAAGGAVIRAPCAGRRHEQT